MPFCCTNILLSIGYVNEINFKIKKFQSLSKSLVSLAHTSKEVDNCP